MSSFSCLSSRGAVGTPLCVCVYMLSVYMYLLRVLAADETLTSAEQSDVC